MAIAHLNPVTLHQNPAFSQGTILPAGARTLYVGGQNGITADGKLAGPALAEQTRQALRNVLDVLNAAGATQEDVAKLTIYLVAGSDVQEGFAASLEVWGQHPTAITVLQVAALGPGPDFLVEIEAVAAIR